MAMLSKMHSVTFCGIDALPVEIQAHISNGLPCFNIVGLANKTVVESKERIRAAFTSLGILLPPKRILINLSPSNITKEGNHFDLPIALALLALLDIIPQQEISNFVALGELSLGGDILAVCGTLATLKTCVREQKGLIFPAYQLNEVALFSERIKMLPAQHLSELISHFKSETSIQLPSITAKAEPIEKDYFDFKDIKGQQTAKKALKVAAAGGHNILMVGPPGIGKSTLGYAIKGILPKLTKKEILETSVIYSISGQLTSDKNLITNRPFRSPHHTISDVALIGGGKKILPGEITLANNGILFLDELAEFKKSALDSLRQPLETKTVLVSRANEKVTMPCKFQLIAATNPCPCGYFTVPRKECTKAPNCSLNYLSRISGPLLDRIDIVVELNAAELPSLKLQAEHSAPVESSADILDQVIKARMLQAERYKGQSFKLNADADSRAVNDILNEIKSCSRAWILLNKYVDKFQISVRQYNKIVKVARTISDLEGSLYVNQFHIAEALMLQKTNPNNNYHLS